MRVALIPPTQSSTIAEVNDDLFLAASDKIEGLKLNNNLTTIIFYLRRQHGSKRETRLIDSLLDLLATNRSIKELHLDVHYSSPRQCLLEKLVNSPAGDNLESLQLNHGGLSVDVSKASMLQLSHGWRLADFSKASMLERYVKRNRDLKQLTIGPLEESPAALQLCSAIATSSISHLNVHLHTVDWIHDLGTKLAQCSSISSLGVCLLSPHNTRPTMVESFLKEGIANMSTLRRLNLFLYDTRITSSIIDGIRSLVLQNGSLDHLSIGSNKVLESCPENWLGLGSVLGSVKSLNLSLPYDSALHVMLPRLQGCESLELRLFSSLIEGVTSTISTLPTVRRIVITTRSRETIIASQNAFLDMVSSSRSITSAELEPRDWTRPWFQAKVDSFCILNRVFGTSLVGFGPSELWTRIFSKIHNESARATFLFRLLCEKPDLISGSL